MEHTSRHFETIVVGAGISGLACASRLLQNDHWRQAGRLCVLEARDRIGGRVEAIHVNGCRLDTGANWIHGIGTSQDRNPLVDILPNKRIRPLSGSVMFRPDGRAHQATPVSDDWVEVAPPTLASINPTMTTESLVIPAKDAGKLSAAMWSTIGGLHELAHEVSADIAKNMTVLDVISRATPFKEAFKDVSSEYHATLRAMPQFAEGIEAAPLNAVSSEHQYDRPGMSLLEYQIDDYDGDQVFLQDGYAAVAAEIAKDLTKHRAVHCDVEVRAIAWDQAPIEIKTSAGTYTAKTVVCTVPLGVLKEREQDLFSPALPDRYRTAIRSLGFGTLDKIFMVYSRAWWTEEPYRSIIKKGISRSPVNDEGRGDRNDEPDFFIGFTDRFPGISIDEEGRAAMGPRMLSLTNLHSLTGFPVLSSFISCANAKQVEGMTNTEAGDIIHTELTAWFGCEPPALEAVYVTRWAADPLSKGSYSHMITGLSERCHREQFQESLAGSHGHTLSFAGEHTSSDHFATVHGALISGRDAANALMAQRRREEAAVFASGL